MEKKPDYKILYDISLSFTATMFRISRPLNVLSNFNNKFFINLKNWVNSDPKSQKKSYYMNLIQSLSKVESVNKSFIDNLKVHSNTDAAPSFKKLIDLIPTMIHIYRNYFKIFHSTYSLLSSERDSNSELHQILSTVESELFEPVESILYTPLEHLHIYLNFINSIIDSITTNFNEYEDLYNSSLLIQSEISRLCIIYPEPQEYEELVALSPLIEDFIILRPGRRLLFKGECVKFSRKKQDIRIILLFSDGIFIGSNLTNNKIKKINFLENGDYEIVEVDDQFPFINSIDIRTKEKSFRSNLDTFEKKQNLINSFNFARTFSKSKWTDLKREFFAPVWVPDESVHDCMICKTKFSLFLRRHHCRVCGDCICSSCSQKIPLARSNGKPELVCTKCIQKRNLKKN